MANGVPRPPDFSVKSSEKYLDDKKQVKYRSSLIGVGWHNTDEKGEDRINVKLHAFPVSGELVVPSRMITLILGARHFSWHVRF
jgi:uncharacterized protein (DUF736 family)